MTRHTEARAFRRWLRRGFTVLAATAAAGTVLVAPAQAANTVSAFGSAMTGRCLDSNSAGQVYTNPCGSGNNYQTWELIRSPLGHHLLRNIATGLCLDSNAAGNVYTRPCDGYNAYQNWSLNPESATHIRDIATNRCLDSNHAGNAYTSPCDGANRYQRWV
ncbi:RICIN domain-containing protein [Micromonospora radicis]|uniref:Xylanase n=1 Tax=Micromonospora radicis TaxID=1894971 RepID=A0A418MTT4_9ACTN|nr:RICIN domain-containing protein [Micromonospora radicis]RIV37750.1 xylanase [Micromonospora radicis]